MCTIEFLTKLSYKQLPFAGCEIALFGFKEEDQLDVVEQAEKNGKYLLHTVVWEKFTVGWFYMEIVCVKIFSSSRVADENFKIKICYLLTNLVYTLY